MGPIKTLRSRSGDTLVEVMASIFIFLLMMGILQGAVSYKKRQRMFPFFCTTHRRSQTLPAPMRTEVTRHEKKEA